MNQHRFRSAVVALGLLAVAYSFPGGQAVAQDSVAQDAGVHDGGGSIRAVVRSASEASIGSDAGARIVALPLKEGATFHKGDLLVAFDCARTRAELKSAQAEWHGHQLAYQNNVALQRYRAAGNTDVQISKAVMEKDAATIEGWTARVEQCEVRAPFDGSVADVLAHVFELPSPTVAIIRIVDPAHLEVDMIVPSSEAPRLKIGDPFLFRVDETGESVEGHVARISAAVDPVSQTMKVVGALDARHKTIMPGMSGKADFRPVF